MRKSCNCVVLPGLTIALAWVALAAGAAEHPRPTLGDVPILSALPKTPAEYARRMRSEPSMTGLARDGETFNGAPQISGKRGTAAALAAARRCLAR